LAQKVDVLDLGLTRAYAAWLAGKESGFEHLRKALVWLSPQRRLERMEDRFSALMSRLQGAGLDHYFDRAEQGARAAEGLSRAFGTHRLDGLARETAGLAHRLDRAFGPGSVDGLAGAVDGLGRRLDKSGRGAADGAAQRLAVLETALRGLDPEGPLERGYALVRVAGTGEFLRDPRRVTKGEALDITVRDGRVAATVTDTRPNEE
jgi:exodeoxyribonuclease VII large subunit